MRHTWVVEACIGAGKSELLNQFRAGLAKKDLKKIIFLKEPDFSNISFAGTKVNALERIYSSTEKDEFVVCQFLIQRALSDYYTTELEKIDDDIEICIMDRWIPSCYIFCEMARRRGIISNYTKKHLDVFIKLEQEHFLSKLGNSEVHTLFLDTPAKQCAKNVLSRGRVEEVILGEEKWVEIGQSFTEIALNINRYDVVGNAQELQEIMKSCL